MSRLWADVRFAFRSLAKAPGASALMIATLAVGLAANGVIFNVLDAMVIRGFEFPGAPRLVRVWETAPDHDEIDRENVAPANLLDWRQQGGALSELIAIAGWTGNLRADVGAERLDGARVTPGFFEALGVPPAQGRSFTADDAREGADHRVVLGHALWQRSFGGEPIVGRSVMINGTPYEVVGVARKGFQFPDGAQAWAPLVPPAPGAAARDQHELAVMGRLADGRTIDDARAELGLVAKRLEREHPQTNTGRGVAVAGFNLGFGDPVLPQILVIWQVAAVLVLVIACVNVANLILARGAERRRELALRIALGAGRARVVRQLLTEGAVSALLAVVVSMPLMALGARALRDHMPAEILRFLTGWENVGADWRTFAFSAALAVIASALFSTVPAVRASRPDLTDVLRDGGRAATAGAGRQRGRNALVVLQLAAALMLVATAGLSVRASLRLLNGPQGYDPDRLLAFVARLSDRTYPQPAQRLAFAREVEDRLRALPGVTAVAVANVLPARPANYTLGIEVEGQPRAKDADPPSMDVRWVEPGYFTALGVPLLRGRAIEQADTADTPPVAVVSRSMAERFWPGRDPTGQRFRVVEGGEGPWVTVVGVSGDVIHQWVMRRHYPTFYRPLAQEPPPRLAFALRTSGDPDALALPVRGVMRAVDPDVAADDVMSQRRALRRATIGMQYVAGVMAAFGVLALLLAVSGVYGVLSYRVSLRTTEIGVRVALGASRRDVLRLTLGQALRLCAIGLGAGVVLAVLMARALSAVLRGAVASDPLLVAGVTAALALAALAAAWVPARRALAVDPAVALREG